MVSLQKQFSELFAYILQFEQTMLQGQPPPSYDQVRHKISAFLREQERVAELQGRLEDYQSARFAFLAWADETILKSHDWQYYSQWQAFLLQEEYENTTNAGEEFYQRLLRLDPAQQELREIYYLCLGLGFKGRYVRTEDEPRLRQIRHEQARNLSLPVETVQDLDKLTPQPYAMPPPLPPPPPLHLLLMAGLVLLVIIPLVLWLWCPWCRPPSETIPPTFSLTLIKTGNGHGKVTSEPAGVSCGPTCATYPRGARVMLKATPEDQDSTFDGWSGAADCTNGVITLTADTTCTATFSRLRKPDGVVVPPPPPPCPKIAVEAVEGQSIPLLLCRVVQILEPFHGQDTRLLAYFIDKKGKNPIYERDESISIKGTMPTKFRSYLYVDYYGVNQRVRHLFPNSNEKEFLFKEDAPFRVGGILHEYKIMPPFGLELVTVIASKNRLFELRTDEERSETYLDELRQALQDRPPADVNILFYFITTREKQ